MTNKNLPEIRFTGFTEEWEQRKLGEVVNRYDNLRVPITASERVSGDTPYFGANGIQDYVEGYTHDGEFILVAEDGANDLKNYPVQYVSGKIWVNNHAHVIQAKEGFADNKFLVNAIKSINLEPFLVGGGRAKLNADVMMNLEVMIPIKNEQIKIGAFFKRFDDTIALHQRELELLKETKKGFLQKMFPKEGEKVPEIRFPGFTEEWEQRKLGEVIRFLNGKAYKQQELLDSGKYRVLRVGNFNTNDRWYYSDLELEENKYANKGDLLYLWATSFGPEIWNEETVIYHYHIWKLEFLTNELDKQYLYTWLLTDKEKIKQTTNGTTMVHVTKGIMEQRLFQFPQDVKEQQKIGTFFKQLDDIIALHQRELDLLKETKKGFLQKLFV